jgi:hypothetical protein
LFVTYLRPIVADVHAAQTERANQKLLHLSRFCAFIESLPGKPWSTLPNSGRRLALPGIPGVSLIPFLHDEPVWGLARRSASGKIRSESPAVRLPQTRDIHADTFYVLDTFRFEANGSFWVNVTGNVASASRS